MRTRRVWLSTGSPPGCGCIAYPFALVLTSVVALMLVLAIDQTRRFIRDGDFGPGNVLMFLLLVGIYLVLFAAIGAIIRGFLLMARARMWLKGTFLHERYVVARRRVDLRSAKVELPPGAEPVLTATDQRSGRSIQLPLTDLPAAELTALADAVLTEPGPRTGDDRTAALAVADRLRDLAVTGTRQWPSGPPAAIIG